MVEPLLLAIDGRRLLVSRSESRQYRSCCCPTDAGAADPVPPPVGNYAALNLLLYLFLLLCIINTGLATPIPMSPPYSWGWYDARQPDHGGRLGAQHHQHRLRARAHRRPLLIVAAAGAPGRRARSGQRAVYRQSRTTAHAPDSTVSQQFTAFPARKAAST